MIKGAGMVKPKLYHCPLSPTKMCRYGGNKVYNYGFMTGASSYCRKDKQFVDKLEKCPLAEHPTLMKE